MKYLLLSVRNIKEGADTRHHERKANSIFSFACIIQVDNATCTKIKRPSLNPAQVSSAGSCIIAHEPLQQSPLPAAFYSEFQLQRPDKDNCRLHSILISTPPPLPHVLDFLMSRILGPIIPKLSDTKYCL